MAQFNLDQLVTYKLVIHRGSFTSAATALGISQPAVSLKIRQWKLALQVRFIKRLAEVSVKRQLGWHCLTIVRALKTQSTPPMQAVA
ncbi:MAG: LysR family transcriptional regulator [Candidatus Malihini olakiniferum]